MFTSLRSLTGYIHMKDLSDKFWGFSKRFKDIRTLVPYNLISMSLLQENRKCDVPVWVNELEKF